MIDAMVSPDGSANRAMQIVRDVASLRMLVAKWRAAGERVALVPTMGALHDGHVQLTHIARQHASRTIVSIFVNPSQFAPHEDFSKYPRSFETDRDKLALAGVDAIFAPDVATIYPEGFSTSIQMGGPAKAGLEDKFRPDHFNGVATVVAKLHNIAAPDVAIYGEKDFQQLAVIRQMTRDLDIPVEIVGAPVVRAADGLALSSRNAYLSALERATAPTLYATLVACRNDIRAGAGAAARLADGLRTLAEAGFAPDYLELRDAVTLGRPAVTGKRDGRLLVAARLGATRLIDNIAVQAF